MEDDNDIKQISSSRQPYDDLSYSPDGRFIVGVSGRKITIWERNSGKMIKTFLSKDRIISVAYHPNGDEIAVGDSLGRILIYNHSGRLLKELIGG